MGLLSSRERAEQRRIERLIAAGKVTPPRGPNHMTQLGDPKPAPKTKSVGFSPYATLATYHHDCEQRMKDHWRLCERQMDRIIIDANR